MPTKKIVESGDVGESRRNVNVRVMNEDDKVVLAFGELVAWVAMPPVEAIQFAKHIQSEAEEILRSDA
jgi:hypothetical protein